MDEAVILKKLKDLDHRVEDLERKLNETQRKAEDAAAEAARTRQQLDDMTRSLRAR